MNHTSNTFKVSFKRKHRSKPYPTTTAIKNNARNGRNDNNGDISSRVIEMVDSRSKYIEKNQKIEGTHTHHVSYAKQQSSWGSESVEERPCPKSNNNKNHLMKLIYFAFGFNLIYIIRFKSKLLIRLPNRSDLKRLRNFCNYTVSYTVGVVSNQSNALLLRVESSWLCRTARFRKRSNFGNSLTGTNKQFKRSFWSPRQTQGSFKVMNNIKLLTYLPVLKWSRIPISVGAGFLGFQQYRKILNRTIYEASGESVSISRRKDLEITCYRMLPWKSMSKAWGWANSINLPHWARKPVLNLYARTFNCDIAEAEVTDLSTYSNLGEFFRRSLRTGVRPVDLISAIVSPCDGKILHYGKVDSGLIEQVKGVTYSLPAFLGPQTWNLIETEEEIGSPVSDVKQDDGQLIKYSKSSSMDVSGEDYISSLLKQKSGTSLFYCVFYLAPGDYHRFHSPVEWVVKFRRHIGGELLSVHPSITGWISGLLSLNERANYIGEWKHGFFSMTAVGATNVGSIHVYRDPALHTNSTHVKKDTYVDKYFDNKIQFGKGDAFGEFNLGSTIVLLFEAPSDYNLKLVNQSQMKVGEALLKVN